MKKIFQTLILIINLSAFAQNQFSKGFDEGFKKGYCFEKSFGCLPPITPITPIPNIGESNNSYVDGYNRGFQVGLDMYRNENPSIKKVNESNTRERYNTAEAKFVDNVIYKAPYELMIKLIEIKDKQYEQWLLTKEDRKKSFQTNLTFAKTNFQNENYQNSINYSKAALSNGFHNDYIY